MNAAVMSNAPSTTSTMLITAASATKVPPELTSATTPATT
jgi:hypothetical protein